MVGESEQNGKKYDCEKKKEETKVQSVRRWRPKCSAVCTKCVTVCCSVLNCSAVCTKCVTKQSNIIVVMPPEPPERRCQEKYGRSHFPVQ